ncbi:MAG: PIN domain-containing protein [Deltaproteobacteria bacterium]|nr:PIN domain-containing protein [Deltaproteobacteria bacterium]
MILLDTSILSLAYRRRHRTEPAPHAVEILRQLILDDAPLSIPGIVFQEVLSGVRTEAQFERLLRALETFPIITAEPKHHILAARNANACRRKGVATSTVDCLIAALATCSGASLFTLDEDFVRMAPICGLKLFRKS